MLYCTLHDVRRNGAQVGVHCTLTGMDATGTPIEATLEAAFPAPSTDQALLSQIAILAAAHWEAVSGDALPASEILLVGAASPSPLVNSGAPGSLAEARAAKLVELRAAYDAAMEQILSAYPRHEPQGWARKLELAQAWGSADTATKALYLADPRFQLLVFEAGEAPDLAAVDALAAKVIAKATAWGAYQGVCTRLYRAARDATLAAVSTTELGGIGLTLPAVP